MTKWEMDIERCALYTPLSYYDYYATVWFNSPFKQDIKRSSFFLGILRSNERTHTDTYMSIWPHWVAVALFFFFQRRSGTRFNRFGRFNRIQPFQCLRIIVVFCRCTHVLPFFLLCIGERNGWLFITIKKHIHKN